MNIIESVSHRLGRIKGQYEKGIADAFSLTGSRPSLADDSAWVNPYAWGKGLSQGRKPKTEDDFIEAFTSWVYITVKLNAQVVSTTPMRLMVAKEGGSKQFTFTTTKSISKAHKRWIESRAVFQTLLKKSEELEEVTDHRFIDLMDKVNALHNWQDLLEYTSMYTDLTGEGYWLVIPDALGLPEQIWPIPSNYIEPKYGKSLDEPIEYYVYKRGQNEVRIEPEYVMRIFYPSPHNVFRGFSCVQGVADAVYIQSQMYETETALFENHARIGGVVTSNDSISTQDAERLKEDFRQKHQGAAKSGKTLFLPRGMEFHRDAMTPDELNYIEGRKLVREEISIAFDVPIACLVPESANRSISEVADYRHAKNGILPRCERIAAKINEKLIPLYGEQMKQTSIFVAFDNPVPEDKEFEHKKRIEEVDGGVLAVNEARSEIGKEDVEGGDDILVSNTKVPLSMVASNQMRQPEAGAGLEPEAEEEQPSPEGLAEEARGKLREWLKEA